MAAAAAWRPATADAFYTVLQGAVLEQQVMFGVVAVQTDRVILAAPAAASTKASRFPFSSHRGAARTRTRTYKD